MVNHDDYCKRTSGYYEAGRALTTLDANAAIEGALAAGANDVLVVDGHGEGRSLHCCCIGTHACWQGCHDAC